MTVIVTVGAWSRRTVAFTAAEGADVRPRASFATAVIAYEPAGTFVQLYLYGATETVALVVPFTE
jgi:hypothetical protein